MVLGESEKWQPQELKMAQPSHVLTIVADSA